MWFKSFKAFKENPENKAILLAVSRYILFSYKVIEDAENLHWRENFIDELLAETGPPPGVKLIPLSKRPIYVD